MLARILLYIRKGFRSGVSLSGFGQFFMIYIDNEIILINCRISSNWIHQREPVSHYRNG